MAASVLSLVILVLGSAAAGANARHAHSTSDKHAETNSVVQKVVEMLQENKVKVIEDLEKESQEMKEYNEFCDDETEALGYAIKTSTSKIADLTAVIDDAAAQVRSLDDEVAELGNEIAAKEKELMDSSSIRKTERDNFESVEKEMISSVDALEKAIVLVKRSVPTFLQARSRPGAIKAFAKKLAEELGPVIGAAWVDKGSAKVLEGFLQDHQQEQESSNDDLELHAPEKKEKRSLEEGGGIIQTLEDMKEKAQETLSSSRMTEMKANHNFQMMKQSLTDVVTMQKTKVSDSQATKAALTESSGKASGELSETKKTKLKDSMTLQNLKGECEIAQTEWVDRQASSKGEIEAIEKAKEILTSRVKVLTQVDDPYEGDGAEDDDAPASAKRHRLVDQLQNIGHKFKSYAMMEMAGAAAQDSFGKIRGLIEDMIAKLVQEANEEASQQAFCDEEKAKSKKEQDDKSMRSDDLRSRIDSATATRESLKENIKELHAEIESIDKGSAEATKIRTENHNTYVKSVKDYKDGAAAVEEAIRVLKEYYASTSALVQRSASSKHAGAGASQGDASSAIVSILETCAEDFSRLATEVETEEQEYVAKYKTKMENFAATKQAKKDEIQGAESEIKVLTVQIQGDSEDLKMVTKELDAVMEYLDKLKPQCETKAMTYEEKKARRQAEIEGLKEALSILDAPSLVQTPKAVKPH